MGADWILFAVVVANLLLQVVQVVGWMVGTLLPDGVGSVWGLLLRI